jgi:hypothetical protein
MGETENISGSFFKNRLHSPSPPGCCPRGLCFLPFFRLQAGTAYPGPLMRRPVLWLGRRHPWTLARTTAAGGKGSRRKRGTVGGHDAVSREGRPAEKAAPCPDTPSQADPRSACAWLPGRPWERMTACCQPDASQQRLRAGPRQRDSMAQAPDFSTPGAGC